MQQLLTLKTFSCVARVSLDSQILGDKQIHGVYKLM